MKDLIQFQNVSFSYNQGVEDTEPVAVLHNVSLSVQEGDFVAVLGHNGSGKSTLAKHINAILQPAEGLVYVDGIDTSDGELVFDIRQRVGMVFQNPDNQIVATVVEEDVAFGPENLGVEPGEIRKRVDSALKDVEMYEFREHAPHQLSGGQKQRVAIAGIIAMRPKCIVLDEATAMLDPRGRREVMRTVRALNREHGTTVVFITHFMDEAVQANRVVVVNEGRILLDGVPGQVFSNVALLKSVGLDVPQVTELLYSLGQEGFTFPPDILTVEDCVSQLTRLLPQP
ncbi:MAG: energy-coupling factor transporter ATPase [Oscillospiraceae bacterium]|jgi:energy-coupling factor transport system ATP-binding protein|nr:energy-coupling factor transporter ATPase [Oscillospiraceae bacterium]